MTSPQRATKLALDVLIAQATDPELTVDERRKAAEALLRFGKQATVKYDGVKQEKASAAAKAADRFRRVK